MISIEAYKKMITENKFQENPSLNDGSQLLSKFLEYKEADLDLLIYLNKLILWRTFYGKYTAYFSDVKRFAENFFARLDKVYIKPELINTVKVASDMILNGDTFTSGVIGTTFMFGVLEFYAKHKLGFRPMEYDFFDKKR